MPSREKETLWATRGLIGRRSHRLHWEITTLTPTRVVLSNQQKIMSTNIEPLITEAKTISAIKIHSSRLQPFVKGVILLTIRSQLQKSTHSVYTSNTENKETKESILSTKESRMRSSASSISTKWATASETESSQATKWKSSHTNATKEIFWCLKLMLRILGEERNHLSKV